MRSSRSTFGEPLTSDSGNEISLRSALMHTVCECRRLSRSYRSVCFQTIAATAENKITSVGPTAPTRRRGKSAGVGRSARRLRRGAGARARVWGPANDAVLARMDEARRAQVGPQLCAGARAARAERAHCAERDRGGGKRAAEGRGRGKTGRPGGHVRVRQRARSERRGRRRRHDTSVHRGVATDCYQSVRSPALADAWYGTGHRA